MSLGAVGRPCAALFESATKLTLCTPDTSVKRTTSPLLAVTSAGRKTLFPWSSVSISTVMTLPPASGVCGPPLGVGDACAAGDDAPSPADGDSFAPPQAARTRAATSAVPRRALVRIAGGIGRRGR